MLTIEITEEERQAAIAVFYLTVGGPTYGPREHIVSLSKKLGGLEKLFWFDAAIEAVGDEGPFVIIREDMEAYREAIERSPFDVSLCTGCGKPVVCLPEGIALCLDCYQKEKDI